LDSSDLLPSATAEKNKQPLNLGESVPQMPFYNNSLRRLDRLA
jgi:hypothetical protein